MTRLPRDEWRVIVRDRYPAYVDWQTFERSQAMLRDNHAEYLRRETRGTPRNGAAEAQQVERLRYQALLAGRQFNRVDPDNRLVAAELERRWEMALRDLRQAEEALARRRAADAPPP